MVVFFLQSYQDCHHKGLCVRGAILDASLTLFASHIPTFLLLPYHDTEETKENEHNADEFLLEKNINTNGCDAYGG